MNWAERQEYYDLIEEDIQFTRKPGQRWVLTLEERHTYHPDAVFHVYSDKGEYMLQVNEIVDVMNLDVKKRLHKFGDTLSGNFRILFSTLMADLPEKMDAKASPDQESRFKLSFAKKDVVHSYAWASSKGDFKRIRPVLKLIWAIDTWRHGAKALGWSERQGNAGKVPEKSAKEKQETFRQEKINKKSRIDPFGKTWEG